MSENAGGVTSAVARQENDAVEMMEEEESVSSDRFQGGATATPAPTQAPDWLNDDKYFRDRRKRIIVVTTMILVALLAVFLIIYFLTCWITTSHDFCKGCQTLSDPNYDSSAKEHDQSKCYGIVPNTTASISNCRNDAFHRCFPCFGTDDPNCQPVVTCECLRAEGCKPELEYAGSYCGICPYKYRGCADPDVNCPGASERQGIAGNNGTHCTPPANTALPTQPPPTNPPTTLPTLAQTPFSTNTPTEVRDPCGCSGREVDVNGVPAGASCDPPTPHPLTGQNARWCIITDPTEECPVGFTLDGLGLRIKNCADPSGTTVSPSVAPSSSATLSFTAEESAPPTDAPSNQASAPWYQALFPAHTSTIEVDSSASLQLGPFDQGVVAGNGGYFRVHSRAAGRPSSAAEIVLEVPCTSSGLFLIDQRDVSLNMSYVPPSVWSEGGMSGGANTLSITMSRACLHSASTGISFVGVDLEKWNLYLNPSSLALIDDFAVDMPRMFLEGADSLLQRVTSSVSDSSILGLNRGMTLVMNQLNESPSHLFDDPEVDRGIDAHNLAEYKSPLNGNATISGQDCLKFCLNNPDCKSVEYTNTAQDQYQCILNDVDKAGTCQCATPFDPCPSPPIGCFMVFTGWQYFGLTGRPVFEVESEISGGLFRMNSASEASASVLLEWSGSAVGGLGGVDLTQRFQHDTLRLSVLDFPTNSIEVVCLVVSKYGTITTVWEGRRTTNNASSLDIKFTDFLSQRDASQATPQDFRQVLQVRVQITPVGFGTQLTLAAIGTTSSA